MKLRKAQTALLVVLVVSVGLSTAPQPVGAVPNFDDVGLYGEH